MVPSAQFHSRELQLNILLVWDESPQSLDLHLNPKTRLVLEWQISSLIMDAGNIFLLLLRTDASLSGWERVLENQSVQGTWKVEEQILPISLQHWSFCHLGCHPI